MKIKGRDIIWTDLVVLAGFILYIGAGVCTTYVITEVGQLTEFAENLEANPEAREMLEQNFNLIQMQWVVIAFIGGMYFLIRYGALKTTTGDKVPYLTMTFYSVFVFLFFFQNFMNDFPYALKLLFGG